MPLGKLILALCSAPVTGLVIGFVVVEIISSACKLQAEEIISTTTGPIINPVTGEKHRAKINLPNGMEFREAEMGSGSTKSNAAFKTEFNETYVQIAMLNLTPQGIPG